MDACIVMPISVKRQYAITLDFTIQHLRYYLVQLETMTYGKPVINTSLPTGVPWVSLDRKTGLTVPPEDPNALKDAIVWMKDHKRERIEMGIKARERVKTEYSQEKMFERILTLYHHLCEG